ncbi:MAG TPA: hypothetical protein VHS28_00115, partial [Chloroflexota bacterium]|nr:hypothetical protein [Chloroflexota bacterium]
VTVGSQVSDELKNFPVPQGFKMDKDGLGTVSSKGDTLSVGEWEGSGTPASVLEFYKKTMPGLGWTEDLSFSTETGGQVSYTKGQSQAVVTINKSDSTTQLSIMVGKSGSLKSNSSSAGGSGAGASSGTNIATTGSTPAPAAAPTKASAAPTKAAAATPKPEATATPAAPKLGSASSVPDELKQVPLPSGFSVVDGSMMRQAAGGVFALATGKWFGKSSVADVVKFYKTAMANDWDEDYVTTSGDEAICTYTNKKKPELSAEIEVMKEEAGTIVTVSLTQDN